MEKSIPLSNASEKVEKEGLYMVDRISALPDDVMGSILSLLTIKEAVKTSVLSKGWRYRWSCIPSLNFDALHVRNEILSEEKKFEELEVERRLYLRWVNQVLKSYRGPAIDEFKVIFELDNSCKYDIDHWIHFALQKKVKKLELDLSDCWDMSENYNLSSLSLGSTFNFLTNLRMVSVNVSGQLLESIFTHCPFLEQVCVEKSSSLINLKVPHLLHKLKRLEICYCFEVESIEIFALNIASFKYYGQTIDFPFKNDQTPTELFIEGDYCQYLIHNFVGISSYLSQLESLTLGMPPLLYENGLEFAKFPIFNKLKQLTLNVCAFDDQSLLVFVPLIEACPFLHKFVLELNWRIFFAKGKRKKVKARPNWSLKEVELIGFVGRANDVELALYLIKRAVMLEKITFDTRDPIKIGTPSEFTETPEKEIARKRAYKLRNKLPDGAAIEVV